MFGDYEEAQSERTEAEAQRDVAEAARRAAEEQRDAACAQAKNFSHHIVVYATAHHGMSQEMKSLSPKWSLSEQPVASWRLLAMRITQRFLVVPLLR